MEELESVSHDPQGLHLVSNGGPNAFNVAQGGAQAGGRGWVSHLEVGGCSQKGVCGSGVIAVTLELPWLRERPSSLPPCSTRRRSWRSYCIVSKHLIQLKSAVLIG